MNEHPIACTLGLDDLASQGERWRALREWAGLARHETATGLRLDFRAGDGVADELHALVAIESECCAWANWSVVQSADRLQLLVETTGDGIDAAHGMFRLTVLGTTRAGLRRPSGPESPFRECSANDQLQRVVVRRLADHRDAVRAAGDRDVLADRRRA